MSGPVAEPPKEHPAEPPKEYPAGPRRAVLVVGGAGTFGRRLVRGLLRTTALDVVVAGRDPERAAAAAAAEARDAGAPGRARAIRLDAGTADAAALRASGAFAVVDAAGPFQHGGHGLAAAAIAAGMHYLDLADARGFVAGFCRLDAAARAAGVVALAGASSTPALSHAALDRLTRGWRRVDVVEVAISPGNRAPRGEAVVRSILSYAGQPLRAWVDGAWRWRPGWGRPVRRDVPGLGRRWLSLCETPDLDLLPTRHGVRGTAVFLAGLELPVLQFGLWLLSLPVRWRLLPTLEPLAGAVRRMAGWLEGLGSDRGGMLVLAEGIDADGTAVRARWALVAEAGDGPAVPTLPALAVLRRLAAGAPIPPGARACVGVLDLDAVEAEFRPYRIAATAATEPLPPALFARALGAEFDRMPAAVRAAHAPGAWRALRGEASVQGAERRPGRWIARCFGFPPAAEAVPVRVVIAARDGAERWTRDFGGRRFRSRLRPSRRGAGFLEEGFGPFRFDLRVPADAAGLGMSVAGWRLGPLPLPRALAPRAEAAESVDDAGRFRFDVRIDLPGVGRLVRYRGWLVEEEPTSAAAG